MTTCTWLKGKVWANVEVFTDGYLRNEPINSNHKTIVSSHLAIIDSEVFVHKLTDGRDVNRRCVFTWLENDFHV